MTSRIKRIFTTGRSNPSVANDESAARGGGGPTLSRSKTTAVAYTRNINSGGGRSLFGNILGKKGKEKDEQWIGIDDSVARELDRQTKGLRLTYKALADATKNFDARTIIGRGGFGHVYKGLLKGEDKRVAIKKMHKGSSHGREQFLSEVKILSKLKHRNVVPLVGWCHEKGELLLVYEFMPNGNLGSHLHPEPGSSKKGLDWKTRYNVILHLAQALLYLHEECRQCVLHRDIKPTNIMLDSEFNPRLSDFGLARLMNRGSIDVTTAGAGTPGYLPPECRGTIANFSKKTDSYSFGVVALEVACGARPVASSDEWNYNSLVKMVWELHGKGKLWDGADERLKGSFDKEQMKIVMQVGLWCTHPNAESRPFMRQVTQVLEFKEPLPALPLTRPMPACPAGMSSTMLRASSCGSSTGNDTRVFSHVSTGYLATNTSSGVVFSETTGKLETTKAKLENDTVPRPVTRSVPHPLTAQTHQNDRRLDGAAIGGIGGRMSSNESPRLLSPEHRLPKPNTKSSIHMDEVQREPVAARTTSDLVSHLLATNQERGQQASNIDIGIPPVYKPTAKLQPFQIDVIKLGATTALAKLIKTEPQLDEAVESVRHITSMLVGWGVPVEDWSSLARYVLQAVKDIQDLKEQLIKDAADAEDTAKTLSNLQKKMEDCSSTIQRDKTDLAVSRRRLDTAGQERARLEAELTELQKQLADLQKRIRVAEDNCSVVQKSITRAETSIAQRSRSMEYLKKSVASTTETLQQKNAKRQEKEGSVSTLVTSMLSRISSFSCNAE